MTIARTNRSVDRLADESRHREERKKVLGNYYIFSKTIGAKVSYPLKMVNISGNGMYLAWDGKYRVPFLVNTLVELSFTNDAHRDQEAFSCLGKIVRFDEAKIENHNAKDFGVKIIFMDSKVQKDWNSVLEVIQ